MAQQRPPSPQQGAREPWWERFAHHISEDIENLQKIAGKAGQAGLRQCLYLKDVHIRLATEQRPHRTAAWLRAVAERECPGCPLMRKTHRCTICSRLNDGKCPMHGTAQLVAVAQPFKWCLTVSDQSVATSMQKYLGALPPRYLLSPAYLTGILADREVPELDVVEELTRLIILQKRRIQARADKEMDMPIMIEQVGREIERKARLLVMLRDTLISLGIVPGKLPALLQTNVNVDKAVFLGSGEGESLESRLRRQPNKIGRFMDAIRLAWQELQPEAQPALEAEVRSEQGEGQGSARAPRRVGKGRRRSQGADKETPAAGG